MIDKKTAEKMRAAGVDASVILDLMLDEEEKQPEPAPEPKKEETKPEPAPKKEEKPVVGNDAILAAIEKLTGVIQASNIRGAGTDPQVETADSILASLIAPPTK